MPLRRPVGRRRVKQRGEGMTEYVIVIAVLIGCGVFLFFNALVNNGRLLGNWVGCMTCDHDEDPDALPDDDTFDAEPGDGRDDEDRPAPPDDDAGSGDDSMDGSAGDDTLADAGDDSGSGGGSSGPYWFSGFASWIWSWV